MFANQALPITGDPRAIVEQMQENGQMHPQSNATLKRNAFSSVQGEPTRNANGKGVVRKNSMHQKIFGPGGNKVAYLYNLKSQYLVFLSERKSKRIWALASTAKVSPLTKEAQRHGQGD